MFSEAGLVSREAPIAMGTNDLCSLTATVLHEEKKRLFSFQWHANSPYPSGNNLILVNLLSPKESPSTYHF